MRNEIKFKRRADIFLLAFCALWIIAGLLMINTYRDKLAEQEFLKSEIVDDNDWLTKRNADLEKQIKLLEEKVEDQQATIDRLMKLETVSRVQGVGMAESRGGPLIEQVATLQTVLDRATAWDMTLEEVIEAPGQYASPYRGEVSDDMKTAFELVFLDGYRAFEGDTTHFATYEPYWTENKAYRGKKGAHHYWGPEDRP